MKTCRMMIFSGVLLLMLSGCASSYAPKTGFFGGGYRDQQLDRNTFKVEYRGKLFTSRERAQAFLLYRCAETTLLHKFDYFAFDDEVDQTGIRLLTGVGAKTTIKAYYGEKPQTIPVSFNAREVIDLFAFMVKQ